jgi:uncharacterized repeat protein (TIGR01451 family)
MNRSTKAPKRTVAAVVLAAVSIVFGSPLMAKKPSGDLTTATLRAARTGHTATLLHSQGNQKDTKVFLIGGENQGSAMYALEFYNPNSGNFQAGPALQMARAYHAAVELRDGRVLVTGGRNGGTVLNSSEIYDPATGTFSMGPTMTLARYGHTATLLADGRVLIAGGEATGAAESFNPATNTFAAAGALLSPRLFHGAALVPDGKVLIAGGVGPDNTTIMRVELFAPAEQGFGAVSQVLQVGRVAPLLRVLPDSKVQIIGGDSGNTMEVFNPADSTFKGLVHLPPTSELAGTTLSVASRRALIDLTAAQNPELAGLLSDPLYSLLLNRTGYTLTELPQSNKALVAGGTSSSAPNSLALDSGVLVASSPATITTDQTDYAPGQIVTISGQGWQPGETASIQIHEQPQSDLNNPLSAVADGNGNWLSQAFAPAPNDLGRNFVVTATGQASGSSAQTSFSDAATDLTITATFGTTLWVDNNQGRCPTGPRVAMLSFILRNTTTHDVTNVNVTFGGFTPATYFVSTQDLTRHFDNIPANSAQPVFFYVEYSALCNVPGHLLPVSATYSIAVTFFDGTQNQSTGLTNQTVYGNASLKAQAGGGTTSTSIGPGIWVGQLLPQFATYDFGNNTFIYVQPIAATGFDAACLRLVGSQITSTSGFTPGTAPTQADYLYFGAADCPGGANCTINMTYWWEILCQNVASAGTPWAEGLSGGQQKYIGMTGTGSSVPLPPANTGALSVSKTVTPSSIVEGGGPVTWKLVFNNLTAGTTNPVPVILSSIADSLPSCMTLTSWSSPDGLVTTANSTHTPAAGDRNLSWNGLVSGQNFNYQVPATGTHTLEVDYVTNVSGCAVGSHTNSASGTVGTTTVTATATLTVNAEADLAVGITDSSSTYTPGTDVAYVVTVSNNGPSVNTSFTLTNVLPSGTTFVSASSTDCGYNSGTRTVTCSHTGNIIKNGSVNYTITLHVSPDRTGNLVNTAQITTSAPTDPVSTNNSATDTDTQSSRADLGVTKSDGSATYAPGADVTYTIGVTNHGPSDNTGFTLTDAIPSGTTFVSASAGCANASGTVTCTSTGLAYNASTSWTITIHVPSSFTGNLVNTTQIATNNTTDPNASNNSATDTDTQASVADLQVTKTTPAVSYMPGNIVVYTVVVTNAGPSNAVGAVVADPLPSGVTVETWTATATGGATGFTASGSGTISDTVNMPLSSTITYTVTVTAPSTASLANTATVTAPAGLTDPNLANNTATVSIPRMSLVLGYPLVTGANTLRTALSYTAGTGLFSVNSIPNGFKSSGADPAHLINAPSSLVINVFVSNTGILLGGAPGDDLVLTGVVLDASGATMYSGTLLTGEVTAFGYRDAGTTDQFQMRFQVTGGALASLYGPYAGLIISAENSTFVNSFVGDFTSSAKFNLGRN